MACVILERSLLLARGCVKKLVETEEQTLKRPHLPGNGDVPPSARATRLTAVLCVFGLALSGCGLVGTDEEEVVVRPTLPEGYRGELRWCGSASWLGNVQFDSSPSVSRTYRSSSGADAATSACWNLVHLPERVAIVERIERDGQLVGSCHIEGSPAPFRARITGGRCVLLNPNGEVSITITGGDLDLTNPSVAMLDVTGDLLDHARGEALRGGATIRLVGKTGERAPFPADTTSPIPTPAVCPWRTCVVITAAQPEIKGEPACENYAASRIPAGGKLTFTLAADGRRLVQERRELPAVPAVTSCDVAAWEGAMPTDFWRYSFSLGGSPTAAVYHERMLPLAEQHRFITCQISWPATLEACP